MLLVLPVQARFLWAVAAVGCSGQPSAVDREDLAAASQALGILPTAIEASGPLERDPDCRGDAALVVPAPSAIRLDVGAGVHTVRGRYAICRGTKPATFEVLVDRNDGGGRRLLEHEVTAEPDGGIDRSHPFLVTFFVDAPASLVLRAHGDRGVRTAWGELALQSSDDRPPPTTEASDMSTAIGRVPDGIRGIGDVTRCFGEPALMVHAPTELRYGIARGTYRIRARYGICPDAFRGSTSPTDGVTFRVGRPRDDAFETFFERRLDPLRVPDDAGLHDLDVETTFPGGDLLFKTEPGDNADSDWSVFSDVRIEPTDGTP